MRENCNKATDSPAGLGGGVQRRKERPITIDLRGIADNKEQYAYRLAGFLKGNRCPVVTGVIADTDESRWWFSVRNPEIENPNTGNFSITSFRVDGNDLYVKVFTFEGYGLTRAADSLRFDLMEISGFPELQNSFATLKQRLDALVGTSLSDAIDNVREVEAFLAGIADTETLTGLLTDLHNKTKAELAAGLQQKQDSLTTSEDLSISDANVLSLTERAKQRLFDDMWLKAVGTYGSIDHTHKENGTAAPYYLNELWLTYDEALAVYNSYLKGANQNEGICHFHVKTNIPISTEWSTDLTRYAQGNINLQILRLPVVLIGTLSTQAFYGCTNLRKIMGLIHLRSNIDTTMFFGCMKLEYVEIDRLKSNLNLQWSPLINKDCLTYLVANADNTAAITITVHADVYAKLTGDTTNAAAAALTAEELAQWQALVTAAAAKNISFATV